MGRIRWEIGVMIGGRGGGGGMGRGELGDGERQGYGWRERLASGLE